MKLTLTRFCHGPEATIGLLHADGAFLCYVLEDQAQPGEKVPGETRIPAGTYQLKLRKEGGKHAEYGKKFPDFHQGMLELQDVPGFKFVLIHIGNKDDDTDACLLTGDQASNAQVEEGFVSQSTQAYKRIYPPIANVLAAGVPCTIEVKNMVA